VHAHDDGVNRWRMANALAAGDLGGSGIRYTDYEEHTSGFTARRELASTSVVLLFNLGEPIELVGADGGVVGLRAGEAFVAGAADATSLSRSSGMQRGVHVWLTPGQLSRICGCPGRELANRVLPFADVRRESAQLGERLAETHPAQVERRYALLDRFLAQSLGEAPAPSPEVLIAMRLLRTRPDITTRELALQTGWSQRHLIDRFKAATGFSPRQYGRLTRFERFSALLRQQPRAPMAELAVEAGFHDQPHLNHATRTYADLTPEQLRARLIPGDGGFVDA